MPFFTFNSKGIETVSLGVYMALHLPVFNQTNLRLIQVNFAENV